MRLRTFTAPDMPAAMQMVRAALGEDAIILSTQQVNGKSVSVTAAVDADAEERQPERAPSKNFQPITARDSIPDDLRFAIQTILRFHNLPEHFIAKLLQKGAQGNFSSALAIHRISHSKDQRELHRLTMEKLLDVFYRFDPLPIAPEYIKGNRWMLVGTPGIGKTLTAAKMATRMAMSKQPLAVITTDTKRAGGIEQLKSLTDILGIELIVAHSRTELWKEVKALPPHTHLVVDTAGCNPYQDNEWEETQSYASIEGIEPILVMPAGGDSAEAIDMVEVFSSLPIKRLLVTRTDSSKRFGGVLAAAAAHELALCNASATASMNDPLQPMDAALLSEMLLRYQYKPESR